MSASIKLFVEVHATLKYFYENASPSLLQYGMSLKFRIKGCCHPYSSWEKGSVENAIGLIRDYVPKKARLEDYSENHISAMVENINNTPKKVLGFRPPSEVFHGQELQKTINLGCCT
jgi:hypothetical protein